jgi:hypothetical protein
MVIGLVLLSILAVALLRQMTPSPAAQTTMLPIRRSDVTLPLDQAFTPEQQKQALAITVGVHLENIYNLRLSDETFNADGWYWLTWPEDVQDLIDEQQTDPKEMVELVNNTLGWDLSIQPDLAEPELRPDGTRYQLYRFSGSFYSDDINLRKYPFNLLSIPIILESRPPTFALDGATPVVLQLDDDINGLVGGFTDIGAFKDVGVSWLQKAHLYSTRFGTKNRSKFSQAEVRVFYKTPALSSFAQWILPLLILMLVVFLAPNLEASLGDLRFAIPSTVLLTLVVMQQTYQAELKPLPYLTFLDRIYLCSYLITIALFGLFVWATNLYAQADRLGTSEEHSLAIRRRVKRADSLFQGLGALFLLIGGVIAWTTS